MRRTRALPLLVTTGAVAALVSGFLPTASGAGWHLVMSSRTQLTDVQTRTRYEVYYGDEQIRVDRVRARITDFSAPPDTTRGHLLLNRATGAVREIELDSGRDFEYPADSTWRERAAERGDYTPHTDARTTGGIEAIAGIETERTLLWTTGTNDAGSATLLGLADSWVPVDGAEAPPGDALDAAVLWELVDFRDETGDAAANEATKELVLFLYGAMTSGESLPMRLVIGNALPGLDPGRWSGLLRDLGRYDRAPTARLVQYEVESAEPMEIPPEVFEVD